MMKSNGELKTTMERLARFQQQVMAVRDVAASPENYRASAGGYLAEIDSMMLAARDYLWAPPAKASGALATAWRQVAPTIDGRTMQNWLVARAPQERDSRSDPVACSLSPAVACTATIAMSVNW